MTIPDNREFWAQKARALLLPTPLAAIDPGGEAARIEAIDAALDSAGLRPGSDEAALRARCDRDAIHIHIPGTPEAAPGPGGRLLHPLSLEAVAPQPPADALTRDFESLLGALPVGASPAAAYRALWAALLEPQRHLDALAGSQNYADHRLTSHASVRAALVGARLGGQRAVLLQVHVGPVQGFIKAARRTHDLWIGSYLVATLSLRAAMAIAEDAGPDAILYPDLASLDLYHHLVGLQRRDGGGDDKLPLLRASLPNRFVALVAETKAEDLAEAAAEAVAETWSEVAEAVRKGLSDELSRDLRDETHWQRFAPQIAAHLEFDATIHPFDPDDGTALDYAACFKRIRALMTAQRRVIVDLPEVQHTGRIPEKCTQCGIREQLGDSPRFWHDLRSTLDKARSGTRQDGGVGGERETLDFRDGEALCAVCLTKRFAHRFYFGDPRGASGLGLDWDDRKGDRRRLRFPSIASITTAPLRRALLQGIVERPALQGQAKRWDAALRRLLDELKFTPPGDLIPGLLELQKKVRDRDLDYCANVDGTWLLPTSYDLETVLRDHDQGRGEAAEKLRETLPEPLKEAHAAYSALRKALAAALQPTTTSEADASDHSDEAAAPGLKVSPYVAILQLDVDNMGKWLEGSHHRTPTLAEVLKASGAAGTAAGIAKDRRPLHPSLHREVSRRQGELASRRLFEIVEGDEILGRVIYSGGDDLLAFVPLTTLFPCLRALRRAFQSPKGLGGRVTVSAGIGVIHWRTPLSHGLQLAREAEEKAKKASKRPRAKDPAAEHLSLAVSTRSGAPLELTAPWSLLDLLLGEPQDPRRGGLLELAARDPEERENTPPLLRTTAIDRLRDELPRFLEAGADDAALHRACLLIGADPKGPVAPLLHDLIAQDIKKPARGNGDAEEPQIIRLCLLLRFLLREHEPLLVPPPSPAAS